MGVDVGVVIVTEYCSKGSLHVGVCSGEWGVGCWW